MDRSSTSRSGRRAAARRPSATAPISTSRLASRALARSSRRVTLDAVDRLGAPLVAVEWEDITAYTRTAIPEDFEPYRLRKLTCGMLWKETDDYIVIVGDYDITNAGKDYRHNDFHIIPRGVIRQLTVLRDPSELVSLDVASAG